MSLRPETSGWREYRRSNLLHRSNYKQERKRSEPPRLGTRCSNKKRQRHEPCDCAAPLKTKNPNLFRLGFTKERQRIDTPRRGHAAPLINKKTCPIGQVFYKKRQRHTLPQIAVPSAQAGLTSLFGMGRGEPRRNNHLKF